ncbi:hypothetical protein SAMN02746066_03457 [Anaerosporobacter mobilis DSM 15930]|jgi:hypothetical protein|uniref:Uncharacterized protein n=1 Tax=Anaerosporobacter mobilis DSM 15930 TaxID=1120996 RepID=A0A1M7LWB2_9FIRM|nr:hypothetical protein [Anaerosporobacter mobilis]SHM82536.1 hypothetical protein SAMN02746066_03457 [Anaerosporobacter mobilis DSM 15930]
MQNKSINEKNVVSVEWNDKKFITTAHINVKQRLEDTFTYQYPIPAATFESVASLGRLIERIMKAEGACPYEIAKVLKAIFLQAGIKVQDSFVKTPVYEQLTLKSIQK